MQAIQSAVPRLGVRPVPVAIYTRVSTIDQVGGRFDSCESQEELARQHIERNTHKGYYLSGVFPDPAYSGGSMKRPGMQALMRHIEAGHAEVVLIYKFERVLRSTDEWTSFRAFLKKHNCRLESPVEDLSEGTAMGRFNNNMRANLAEYHRLDTAEKVRVKMRLQAERGMWNAGQIPYGYDYDRETQTLRPNAAEAEIVRRVYEAAAQLVPLTDIANSLNAEGHRTKARIFKRRDGNRENVGARRFRSDKLRKIIRSPVYLGRVRFKGEDFAAKHEALVPVELWERANAAVTKTLQPARCRLQARDKHFHLLKGLAYCGHCGRAMIPNASGKRDGDGRPYRYYTCGHAHKEKADASCPLRHVSASGIETTVIGFMGKVARQPEIVRQAVEGSRSVRKSDRAPLQAKLATLDKSLARANQGLRNCVEALAAGGAEMLNEELRERAADLKAEKQRFLVEREQVRQALLDCDQDALDIDRLTRATMRFHDLFPELTPDEQKALVALCIARVEIRAKSGAVTSDGERVIELKLKLHAARLVEGMENRVVVQSRATDHLPFSKPSVTFDCLIELGSPGKGASVTIVAPFRCELRVSKAPQPATVAAPTILHPIHRALAWKRSMAANPKLSFAELARRSEVSAPTLTHHFKLLQLLPEIQEFLLGLKDSALLHKFSLNRMKALAVLPPDEQREAFDQLRAS